LQQARQYQKVNNALQKRYDLLTLDWLKQQSLIAKQRTDLTKWSAQVVVFYNYLLKCFVVIDLKTTKLSHADIGQMDMYVRMFDALKRGEDDNPTIGIILCAEKDETMVKYSVLKENKQLFASKYKTVLPTEDELAEMIAQRNLTLIVKHL